MNKRIRKNGRLEMKFDGDGGRGGKTDWPIDESKYNSKTVNQVARKPTNLLH